MVHRLERAQVEANDPARANYAHLEDATTVACEHDFEPSDEGTIVPRIGGRQAVQCSQDVVSEERMKLLVQCDEVESKVVSRRSEQALVRDTNRGHIARKRAS